MHRYVFDNAFQRIFLDGIMIWNADMMLSVLYSRSPDMATCLSGFMIAKVFFQKL